jgi:hypothetical protein
MNRERAIISFLRGALAGMLLGTAGPLGAVEMEGATMRITRTSANQGGSGASPMGSASFRLRGTVGEASQGTAASATLKVADGLMKIFHYPGTITDLSPVPGTGAGQIRLTWTAPGADGKQRTVSKYVVKYSTHPDAITNQEYFESTATLYGIIDPGVPGSPGSQETYTLAGLTPGTSYYIAIEARDEDKNQGYLSNSTWTYAQATILSVLIENLDNTDPSQYGFGEMSMNSASVSTAAIRVSNVGTTPATWSLQASTITVGSPWQLTSGAVGFDAFRLSAGFDEARPPVGAFSSQSGSEDRLTPVDTLASSTAFSIDGSTTGANVSMTESRRIWFLMETPLITSTTEQQLIRVTVTANTP